MITTKNVDVDLTKRDKRLKVTTTNDIDASPVVIPKEKWKPNENKSITTHSLADVQDIKERELRRTIQEDREKQKKAAAVKKPAEEKKKPATKKSPVKKKPAVKKKPVVKKKPLVKKKAPVTKKKPGVKK